MANKFFSYWECSYIMTVIQPSPECNPVAMPSGLLWVYMHNKKHAWWTGHLEWHTVKLLNTKRYSNLRLGQILYWTECVNYCTVKMQIDFIFLPSQWLTKHINLVYMTCDCPWQSWNMVHVHHSEGHVTNMNDCVMHMLTCEISVYLYVIDS